MGILTLHLSRKLQDWGIEGENQSHPEDNEVDDNTATNHVMRKPVTVKIFGLENQGEWENCLQIMSKSEIEIKLVYSILLPCVHQNRLYV